MPTDGGDVVTHPAASAGLAVHAGGCGTFEMLRHADIALYHAKQQRCTHRLYRPGLRIPRTAGRHGPRLRDHQVTGDSAGGEVAR